MNNEEIIRRTENGAELYNALYMNNIKLINKLCTSYYKQHSERFKQCGVEPDDLLQECYFAIPEAVSAFRRKGEGMKFVTFLRYPVINCLNNLCSVRTAAGRKEPLNICKSLDMPVTADKDCTLSDIVPDKISIETMVTDRLEHENVFPLARETLSDGEYDIICRCYRDVETVPEIAELLNSNVNDIISLKNKALRKLRKNQKFMEYRTDILCRSIGRSGLGFFKNTGMSSVEWALRKMENYRE